MSDRLLKGSSVHTHFAQYLGFKSISQTAIIAACVLASILSSSTSATQDPEQAQASSQPSTISFAFKNQTIDEVIDFLARATGIPVIREIDAPKGTVTFIGDRAYPIDDALRVLNTVLRARGVVVRRDSEFLYFGSLANSPKTPVPTSTDGRLPEGTTPDQIVTVVIPLNNATADSIVKALQPLAAPYSSMVSLPDQNALILTETADQVMRLRAIATALDAQPGFQESVRVFPLAHVNAEEVLAEVLRLLSESENKVLVKQGGAQVVEEITSVKGVRVVADPRLNALVAVGVESRLQVVAQILTLLDAPSGSRRGDYASFQLSLLDPAEAKGLVERLFERTPAPERPTVLQLPMQGRLVVTGSASAIGRVEALLNEVDPPAEDGQNSSMVYRVIDSTPGTATLLASTLRQMLPPVDARLVRISTLPNQDAVMVAGTRVIVERVTAIAAEVTQPLRAQREVRVMAVDDRNSRAQMVEALSVLEIAEPGLHAELSITFDESVGGAERALLVGQRAALVKFTTILSDLRSADKPLVETRAFSLREAIPSRVVPRLSALSRGMQTQFTSGAPDPIFSAFDEAGELLVTAVAGDFELIERLISVIDERAPTRQRIQVIPLRVANPERLAARAAEVAATLGESLPEHERGTVAYEFDTLSGNLILTGDDRGISAFQAAMQQLQRLAPPVRTARMYSVQQANPGTVLAGLREMLVAAAPSDAGRSVPAPAFSVIESTRTIVATAEPLQHQFIADAIRRLDVTEPGDLPPLKLFQIRSADAAQIARMLTDQYNRRAPEQRREQPADIRSDAATNTLIVAAHDSLIPDIRAFVAELNESAASDAERVTEIFPLKVAKAENLARAMERLYPEPPMPLDRRGRPQPWLREAKEVTVSADPASNSLIVDAPAERIPAFTALVEKLDRVELPPQATLRTYSVQRADLGAVARTLQSLANQGSLSAPSTAGTPRVPVTIESEELTRTLIVAGDDHTHDLVERILQEIGSVPVERELRVVRIANQDPQAVADQALSIYTQQTQENDELGSVDVNVDRNTNALLVVADPEAMARFLRIIDELEQQAGPARELRLIEFQHARAEDVAIFLDDLIESSTPFVEGPFTNPVFDPISRNNTMLVAAQPEQFAVIDSLIRSLDQPEGANAGPLRILRLRTAEAANLAGVLNQAFAQRSAEERSAKPVSIKADANTNTLVVSAHPDVLPEIQAIVDELNDSQTFDSEDREIRIFPLQVARAEELARTLDQMFPAPPVPLDRRGRPIFGAQETKEVQVRADPQTNSIIVDAPGRRLAGFEQLVQQLDRAEMRAQTELRTYKIIDADLNAVKRSIDRIAASGGIASPQSGAAVIVEIEPNTDTLVVSAPIEAFLQIERLIEAVDEASAVPSTRLGFYALTSTRSDQIAPIVDRVLRARAGELAASLGVAEEQLLATLTVTSEPRANALVINAPSELVDLAAEIVAQLDTGARSASQTRVVVVPLAHADPAQTARAITQASDARVLTSADLTIIPAESSSAIIVSGTDDDIAFVQGLASELDTPTITDGRTVKTVYLEHNSARSVVGVLQQLFVSDQLNSWQRMDLLRRTGRSEFEPSVTIAADEDLNAVILSAPPELVAVVEQTIRELDRPRVSLRNRQTRILTLTNANALATAETIQAVFDSGAAPGGKPPMIRAETSSNAIVVVGDADQLQRITDLARSLDEAAVSSRDIRTIPIDPSKASASQIAETLQRLLVQEDGSSAIEVVSIEQLLEMERLREKGQEPASDDDQDGTDDSNTTSRIPGTILVPQPIRLIINFKQAPFTHAALSDREQASSASEQNPAGDEAVEALLARALEMFEAETAAVEQGATTSSSSSDSAAVAAPQHSARKSPSDFDITIAADPESNALIVVGSDFVVERITQLAEQLESQLPPASTRIRILQLGEAVDPRSVANLVNATMRQLGNRSKENPGGLTGRVAVIPDTASGSLIIAANDSDFATLTPLLTTAASAQEAQERSVRILQLENVTADAAARAIRDMLSGSPVGRQANRFLVGRPIEVSLDGNDDSRTIDTSSLRVSSSPDGTSLIVAGEDEAVDFIADFVSLIDQSKQGIADTIRVYQLNEADAINVRRSLQAVFDGSRQGRSRNATSRAVFQADRQTNTLIVTANAQQHKEIQRLLEQLDAAQDSEETKTEFFTLESAQPSLVARTMRELVVGQDAAKRARMTITANDASSLLIVKGLEEDLEEARTILAQLDKAPDDSGFAVRSIKLERADANAVASAIQRFFDDRARATSKPGQRPQRTISVVGERTTSTVLVSASAKDFRLIEQIIKNFDADGGADQLDFEVITLKNAQARDVYNSIEGLAWMLSLGPRQRELIFIPDERLNAIVILGAGESIDVLREVITKLDAEKPGDGSVVTVRAFKIEKGDPFTIARAAERAVQRPGSTRRWWEPDDATSVRFEVDWRSSTILAIGTEEQLNAVANLIEQLDTTLAADEQQVEVIDLAFADAATIAITINRFFTGRAQQAGAREQAVRAVGQRGSSSVILSGPKDQLTIATDLVSRLDAPDTGTEDRTLDIMPLTSADPVDVVRTLRAIYPRQRSTGRFPVVASPDARTRSLIVSMPTDLAEEVRALVAKLDAPTDGDNLLLETFKLDAARAGAVKQTLEQTLQLTRQAQSVSQPADVERILDEDGNAVEIVARITADERANAVIVAADEPSMRLIAKLIKQLDAQDASPGTEVRVFKLERALASDVAVQIRSFTRAQARAEGLPIPAIEASRADNSLIVSATRDQFEAIEQIIRQFDSAATPRTTEFISLEFADATQVSRALENFYGPWAPAADTPGARTVSITADPASNSLVVTAPADQWERIRALVADLDDERYDPSRQLEVIPLMNADAASVAEAIRSAFEAPLAAEFQRERERQEQRNRQRGNQGDIPFLFTAPTQLVDPEEVVAVSAEPITNTLIVSASKRDLERVRSIVTQLDVAAFTSMPKPRIIIVPEGRPSEIQEAIDRLYRTGDRQRSSRGLRVVADDEARVLIVRGSDEEFAEISQLVEQLGSISESDGPKTHTITLKSQAAVRLRPILEDAFAPIAEQRGVTLRVSADPRTNTLVVSTSSELFEELRSLAFELDGRGDVDSGSEDETGEGESNASLSSDIKIVVLTHRAPNQMRELLIQLGVTRQQPPDQFGVVTDPVSLVTIPESQSIAISGYASDIRAVSEVIALIDTPPSQYNTLVQLIPLTEARAAEVASVVREMLTVAQSDTTSQMARSLSEQVRRLRLRFDSVSSDDVEIDLAEPIRLEPIQSSNAILVTASKSNLIAITQLVKMLDTLPVGDAVTIRIFHLSNTAASTVERIVRQLFAQGDVIRRTPGTTIQGIPSTETGRALAGDVAVTVDERTNAVIVAGREQAVALVEVLINQLDSTQPANWVETRVVQMVHADAQKMAETINRVIVRGVADSATDLGMQRQIGRLRVSEDAPSASLTGPNDAQLFVPLTKLVVEPESQLNALILIGSKSNLDILEQFIRLLDVARASRNALIRVYPLEHASADRVRGLLLGLFQDQVRNENLRPEDQVSITADTRTNSLVIATSTRSFALLEQLLKTLDSSEVNPTVTVELISVGNGDAASLAPKIERIMRDRLRANSAGAPSARDIVTIVPDEASNALIVTASEENLVVIRSLVQRLSADSSPRGGAFEIFPLRSAEAEDLADLLNEIYVDQANKTRGDRAITVEPDERLNAIVATGTPQDIEEIRRLIDQLDTTTVGSVTEIRNIALRSANALEMVNLLNGIIAGNRRGAATGRQATVLRFARGLVSEADPNGITEAEISAAIRAQVSLEPDLRTNSILVSAPPSMMVLIEALIDELDTLADGARTIRIFKLVNADAEAMAEVLRELFNLRRQGGVFVLVPSAIDPNADPQPGDDLSFSTVPDERRQLSITIDPRTNSLLVSGSQEYLDRVEEVVTNLDSEAGLEREQITVELKNARVEEVADALQQFIRLEQDRIARTLGPDASGSIIRRLEREISVVGVPGSSRLILSASPRYMETIRALITELDAPPKQVLIQVLLAEVTLDSEDTFGVELEVGPFGPDLVQGATRAAGAGFGGPFGGASLTSIGVPNLSVSSVDFNLLIRALEVQGRLEVLSRPQILVNDNEEAFIQVGEEIQLVTNVERGDNGRVSSDVEPRQLGVILNVTPSISDDNFVRLDIGPEISALTARTTQVSEDFAAPVISRRTADTTITVKDNETIIIGGLIQNRSETRKFKVPFLGDIPLLGALFNSNRDTTQKTELLIILTPRVISDQREAVQYTDEEIERLSLPDGVKDAIRTNDINIDQLLSEAQDESSEQDHEDDDQSDLDAGQGDPQGTSPRENASGSQAGGQ